jgi:NAD(P)-dependent dehydrogenase (short-subunit alcohol dehydrogenase family)
VSAPLTGKTAVITGATSGIGAVAAETLAAQGATIVFIARDPARGAATLARLQAIAPGADHRVHHADLSSIAQTRRAAAEIALATPCIDLLINNAGMVEEARTITAEGLELTFATNHLAPFTLTCCLRGRLAENARIITTSSVMHAWGRLDFDDLQMRRRFHWIRAYSNSKLCNVLFTRALAGRLAGSRRTANCFHPGFVATRFGASRRGPAGLALRFLKLFAISPRRGAATLIQLATDPGLGTTSGAYFVRGRAVRPAARALDDAAAARLWTLSAALSGVDW